MKRVILLTHSRELDRKTGTGPIVKKVLGEDCEIILWKRREPNDTLLNVLGNSVLLYPEGEDIEVIRDDTITTIILIDGTWQEARKIYNKSPYLKKLRKVSIKGERKSIYTLRRNQIENGLCTAEAVSVVASILGEVELSYKLIRELTP